METIEKRADNLSTAVWLIGIGILIASQRFFPGIIFVAVAASLVKGVAEGKSWEDQAWVVWALGFGFWFMFGFKLWALLVTVGIGLFVSALASPVFRNQAVAKPYVDNYLE